MDIFTSDCCVPTGYLQMCMADTIVIFTSERRGKTTHTVLCITGERKSCTSDIIYFLDFTVDFNAKAATLDNRFICHCWNADSIYVMVLTCVGGWVGQSGRCSHSPSFLHVSYVVMFQLDSPASNKGKPQYRRSDNRCRTYDCVASTFRSFLTDNWGQLFISGGFTDFFKINFAPLRISWKYTAV
jgi:hypothetical protein